jgi:hypothetical protein
MDENFLKEKARAMELIDEMEKHRRFFSFYLFSSAETIVSFGIENLMRLGVLSLWIGFESKTRQGLFSKNDGIDAKKLVGELRDHGISVLASGILCMEHHTPDNMQEDIDFLVGLESDLVQFMLLLPLPVTAVYQSFAERGMLDRTMPYEEWHGQNLLPWRHPAFGPEEPAQWLAAAFRKDYEANSSSIYRYAETAFRGYETLAAMQKGDPNLDARREQARGRAMQYGLTLGAIARFAVNDVERERARSLEAEMRRVFGPLTAVENFERAAAVALAAAWRLRVKLIGDGLQPKTIVTRFNEQSRLAFLQAHIKASVAEICETPLETRAAAMSRLS